MSAVFPINIDVRWRSYTASAGQTVFAIPFPFQDDNDITIVRIALDGTEATLSFPADYTLSGAGNPAGGSFVLTAPAVAGVKYRPIGRTVLQRILSIVRGGRYKSAATDADLDRLMITAQEHRRDIDRSWKAPLGAEANKIVPGVAGELMKMDAEGNIVGSGENVGTILGTTATAVAAAEAATGAAFQTANDRFQTGSDAAASADARNKAQKWAENAEDAPVEPGLFSAKHWAIKAASYVAGNIGQAIHGFLNKATWADADELVISDSANGWNGKRTTWAQLKAMIGIADNQRLAALINAGVIPDCNNIVDTGWHFVNKDVVANLPLAEHGYLQVFKQADSAPSNYAGKQIYYQATGRRTFERYRFYTVGWQPWVETTPLGRESLFIPADQWVSGLADGAAVKVGGMATNGLVHVGLDFDPNVQERAHFLWHPDKRWNKGAVSFQFEWTGTGAGSGGVAFQLAHISAADGESLDQAYASSSQIGDTYQGANILHISPESSAVQIAGSPGDYNAVLLRLTRLVSDASDTLAIDARLLGVRIFYTTAASVE